MLQRFRQMLSRGGQKSHSATQPGNFFGLLRKTNAGVNVSIDGSLQASAVFAAVKVLSEDVAKLPVSLVADRDDGGSDVVRKHPAARVMRQPNSWQTSFEMRQMLMQDLALRGNAFAVIFRNGRGEVASLIPVRAGLVTIHTTPDGDIFYQVGVDDSPSGARLKTRDQAMIPQEDMLHLRWMARDGVCGISPIAYQREAVALSLAAEQHGAASFGNDATPGGVLKHPNNLSQEAAQRLRQQWQEKYQGPNKAGAPAVLEEGMEFEKLEISNEDRQFLETRRFQVEEVARIFRVPPHMIGDLSHATFSNIESQSLDYVKNTLMAWLELWESALARDLLSQQERDRGVRFEFDTQRILRGTISERFDAHTKAINNGIKTPNEVREEEGLNPVDGGNTLLRPLNLGRVGVTEDSEQGGDQGQVEEANG